MDRFAEPTITDAEWAPLHAELSEQMPRSWENTRPTDVPELLRRLGRAFSDPQPTRHLERRSRDDVRATVSVLGRRLHRYRHPEGPALWTTLRAAGCLGIADRHLLNQIMMLGLAREDRTVIELSHAFARMGEAKGGVAIHLLHIHLSPRSAEARTAARRALVHLGPAATEEVIDLLASSGEATSGWGTDSDVPPHGRPDEVMRHARMFLDAIGAATAPRDALAAGGSQFDAVRNSVDTTRIIEWSNESDERRAARHGAAMWLLREAVPSTGC